MKSRLTYALLGSSLIVALAPSCVDWDEPGAHSGEWSYASETNGPDAGPDGGEGEGDAGAKDDCEVVRTDLYWEAVHPTKGIRAGSDPGSASGWYIDIEAAKDGQNKTVTLPIKHPAKGSELEGWLVLFAEKESRRLEQAGGPHLQSAITAYARTPIGQKPVQVKPWLSVGIEMTNNQFFTFWQDGKKLTPPPIESICDEIFGGDGQ